MTGGKTVVELRVHGVSGTPPEAMLNCPTEFLKQVAGDRDAGFYRRQEWIDDAASPPTPGGWRRLMEAYSWGGLTSRSATRAVWLLFLPFSLINLAHWMLPPARRRWPAVVSVVLLRLLALSFTLTLLLAMAAAVLDITVWQCASIDYCSAGWGPLALISGLPLGCRLAIGALPLVAVILALWFLGREETMPKTDPAATQPDSPEHRLLDNSKPPPDPVVMVGDQSPLTATTFWNGDDAVQCMRACHVSAWTAGLAALVLAAPVTSGHSGAVGTVNQVLLVVNLLVVVAAIGATAWPKATGRGGDPAPETVQHILMGMRWFALGTLAVSLIWVACTYRTVGTTALPFLPGLRNSIYLLTLAQAVLLLAVLACIVAAKARTEHVKGYEPSLGGYTAWFVALLGWLVGGGFSAGLGLWTAQTLGNWVYSADEAMELAERRREALAGADLVEQVRAVGQAAPLIVPPAYVWASVAVVIMIGVAVIALIRLCVRAFGADAVDVTDKLAAAGDIEKNAPVDLLARISRTRQVATLTDGGPRVIASLVAIGAALVLVAAVLLFLITVPFIDTFVRQGVGGISVGATVAIVAGLIGLVALAFRNRQTRRNVAILWDVITFWPRANHPLTPPSYGGRTVFDLRLRMRALRDSPDPTEIVLVAHSQGTIIAAATLMQACADDERYALLTFGSPLRRLYAANFPAYFGHVTLDSLKTLPGSEGEARWINLWALTDPIGGWVFAHTEVFFEQGESPMMMSAKVTGVDCRVLDVAQQIPRVGSYDVSRVGAICGHSGFWTRGEYVKAVEALQDIVIPDDDDVVDSTAMPTSPAL